MSAAEFRTVLGEANKILDEWRSGKGKVSVLEAGGGAFTMLKLPDTHITTIDISEDQIRKNKYADNKIVGDLEEYQFEPGQFDIVICFDVLEHLRNPRRVIDSLTRSLKPGGILYIAAPYNYSVASLIAKFTPHWFHVFCYRHIFGPNPTDPKKERLHEFVFPTYLRTAMNPFRITRHVESLGMTVRLLRLYSRDKRDHLYNASRMLGVGYDAITWTGRVITFGMAKPDCTDYVLLAQRPAVMETKTSLEVVAS